MQPIPYLFFKGTCAEAMRFYASVFGSDDPEIMTVSTAPKEVLEHMPGVSPDSVMHSAVKIGDGWVYASDDSSGETPAMAGNSISVSYPDAAEARRIFDALSDGGEVRMAFEPTFFSPGFGTLTDRYGTRWMVLADFIEG
jgi:PhnB protein